MLYKLSKFKRCTFFDRKCPNFNSRPNDKKTHLYGCIEVRHNRISRNAYCCARLFRQLVSNLGRGLAIGIAIAFCKIGRGRKTYFVGNLAYRFVGRGQELAAPLQTQPTYQLNRSVVGERLDFAIELRAFKPHPGSYRIDIQAGIAHLFLEYIQETVVKFIVDIARRCAFGRQGFPLLLSIAFQDRRREPQLLYPLTIGYETGTSGFQYGTVERL